MKPILSAEELAELGLEGVVVGDSELLPEPRSDVSRGRAVGAVVSFEDLASDAADTELFGVGVAAAVESGIRIERAERNPSILMLHSERDTLRVVGDTGAWARHLDPATVLLDLRLLVGHIALVHPDRTGVALRRDGERFVVGALMGASVDVEPTPAIESPVEEWLAACNDAWLVSECRAQLDTADPYRHVVAVGLLARFRTPDDPAETLRKVLSAEPCVDPWRERGWAREWGSRRARAIELMALSEADLLESELGDGLETADGDDERWRRATLHTLHRRDDLEGVSLLLDVAKPDNAVRFVVDELDRVGRRFAIAIPDLPEAEGDERLVRAASVNPGAWWVMPVVEKLRYPPLAMPDRTGE